MQSDQDFPRHYLDAIIKHVSRIVRSVYGCAEVRSNGDAVSSAEDQTSSVDHGSSSIDAHVDSRNQSHRQHAMYVLSFHWHSLPSCELDNTQVQALESSHRNAFHDAQLGQSMRKDCKLLSNQHCSCIQLSSWEAVMPT